LGAGAVGFVGCTDFGGGGEGVRLQAAASSTRATRGAPRMLSRVMVGVPVVVRTNGPSDLSVTNLRIRCGRVARRSRCDSARRQPAGGFVRRAVGLVLVVRARGHGHTEAPGVL